MFLPGTLRTVTTHPCNFHPRSPLFLGGLGAGHQRGAKKRKKEREIKREKEKERKGEKQGNIDNDVVSDPKIIASAFNNHLHFASKFDDMYDPLDLAALTDSIPSHGAAPFSFPPFTVSEVLGILENLDASKSPGPDELLPVFLKVCCKELAPVLCDLFNVFIQKGQCPAAWKDANVVPIYKGSG